MDADGPYRVPSCPGVAQVRHPALSRVRDPRPRPVKVCQTYSVFGGLGSKEETL